MMKLEEIMEVLNPLEKERVPNNSRILGIAIYVQTPSTRRTAKIILEFRPVSHTAA